MRNLGTLEDEGRARRMADYLVGREMPAEVRGSDGRWGVWIYLEDHFGAASEAFEAFRNDPDAPEFAAAAGMAKAKRREAGRTEREHRKRTVQLSGRLAVIGPRRCPGTYALIVISVLVALGTSAGDDEGRLDWLYFSPPKLVMGERTVETPMGEVSVPTPVWRSSGLEPILKGEVWRLFSSMFIHYGWPHLIFNMLALHWYGGMIELRTSTRRLLVLAFAGSAVGSVAEYAWDLHTIGPDEIVLPGGMSGVVYGLFGYAWMKSDYDPGLMIRVSSRNIGLMLGWLVLCMTGAIGPIANAGHVGGLVFGMVAGLAPYLIPRRVDGP